MNTFSTWISVVITG